MTTWRKQLQAARQEAGDSSEIIQVSPDTAVLDVEFNAGYGGSEGLPLLVWSEHRVYFPVVYDGAEWMESAPRNPVPDGQGHVGGQ